MRIFPQLLCPLAAAFLPCLGGDDPSAKVPTDFLPTASKRLQEVLAMPITADFRAAPLREAIDVLRKQTLTGQTGGLNIVVQLAAGEPLGSTEAVGPPVVTDHFENVPLRLVLYKLGLDTHLAVDWFYLPEKPNVPWGISIHGKR